MQIFNHIFLQSDTDLGNSQLMSHNLTSHIPGRRRDHWPGSLQSQACGWWGESWGRQCPHLYLWTCVSSTCLVTKDLGSLRMLQEAGTDQLIHDPLCHLMLTLSIYCANTVRRGRVLTLGVEQVVLSQELLKLTTGGTVGHTSLELANTFDEATQNGPDIFLWGEWQKLTQIWI